MSRSDKGWTIVSIHYRDPRPVSDRFPAGWESRSERYVVYTPFVSEAKVAVDRWLDADPSRRNCLDEVNYYARRYVGLERELRSSGRIIPC